MTWTRLSSTIAVALVLGCCLGEAARAQSASGGEAAYVTTGGITSLSYPMNSVSFPKGKKKRVLELQWTLSGNASPCSPGDRIDLFPSASANGIFLSGGGVSQCHYLSNNQLMCAGSGTLWLDLDAQPTLWNVPLTVVFGVGATSVGSCNVLLQNFNWFLTSTLVAKLQKK